MLVIPIPATVFIFKRMLVVHVPAADKRRIMLGIGWSSDAGSNMYIKTVSSDIYRIEVTSSTLSA